MRGLADSLVEREVVETVSDVDGTGLAGVGKVTCRRVWQPRTCRPCRLPLCRGALHLAQAQSNVWRAWCTFKPRSLAPDCKDFAVLMALADNPYSRETRGHVTLMLNFFNEVRRLAPVK